MRHTPTTLAIGIVMVAAVAIGSTTVAGAEGAQAPTTTTTVTTTVVDAIGGGAPGPVVGGGDTPQPTGRAAPPRGQRIGDSLIWFWVVALLAGGCLVGAFAGRRRPHTTVDPAAGDGAGDGADGGADDAVVFGAASAVKDAPETN